MGGFYTNGVTINRTGQHWSAPGLKWLAISFLRRIKRCKTS